MFRPHDHDHHTNWAEYTYTTHDVDEQIKENGDKWWLTTQVLHTFVFVGLPLLTHLNLSHNQVDITGCWFSCFWCWCQCSCWCWSGKLFWCWCRMFISMLMLQLHTIASGAFVLPALQVIDLSHNAMVEVRSGCLIVRLPNCYKGLFIYYVTEVSE